MQPDDRERRNIDLSPVKNAAFGAAGHGVYFIPAEGGRLEVPTEMFDDFNGTGLIERDSDGRIFRLTSEGRRAAGLAD